MSSFSYLAITGIANVLEFGADPAGVDDAAGKSGIAIQQVSKLGGIVEIPPGTYRLGSSPSFGSATNITIYQHPGVTFTGVGTMPTAAGNNNYFYPAAPGGTLTSIIVAGNSSSFTGVAVAAGAPLLTLTPGAHTAVVAEVNDVL